MGEPTVVLPVATAADRRRVLGDPPYRLTEGMARDVMRRAGFRLTSR